MTRERLRLLVRRLSAPLSELGKVLQVKYASFVDAPSQVPCAPSLNPKSKSKSVVPRARNQAKVKLEHTLKVYSLPAVLTLAANQNA